MSLLTLVIVTYNSASVVGVLLDSAGGDWPVIVVDNGSSDDTVQVVSRYPNVRVIQSCNEGYGRGANRGMASVTTPYGILLNPDVVLAEGALQRLVDAMEAHPHVAIMGAMLDSDSKVENENELVEVDWIVGALMMIRLDLFRRLGGFDERIFLFYEETDLCSRFVQAGHMLALLPSAKAWHKPGNSSPPSQRVLKIRAWHFAWSKGYYHRMHCSRAGFYSKVLLHYFNALTRMLRAAVHVDMPRLKKNYYELAGMTAYLRGVDAYVNGVGRFT